LSARVIALLTIAVALVVLCGSLAAQTSPLAPGYLTAPPTLYNNTGVCPADFFSDSTTPATCYSATMACSIGAGNIGLTFSQDVPVSPVGTIVFFGSGGGETPNTGAPDFTSFAQYYFNHNYQIVQVAWLSDWENTNTPLSPGSFQPSILNAACRPAGFLNYVYNNLLPSSGTPMCAQGSSAGSGAIAYSLAWYGDSNLAYLNLKVKNAELLSGPVFGDISLGCSVPAAGQNIPTVPICYPGQQFGCSPGTTGWGNFPAYIGNYATHVRTWTGQNSCANGTTTTQLVDQIWKGMSIVNGSSGSFSYRNTGLAGWLCNTYMPGTCTAQSECPNNSAAEGEQFYNQFTSTTQAVGYRLTGILQCNGAELVGPGGDPDSPYNGVLGTGQQAIEDHMLLQCK
jgi:hypothetical protein